MKLDNAVSQILDHFSFKIVSFLDEFNLMLRLIYLFSYNSPLIIHDHCIKLKFYVYIKVE